MSVTVIQGQSFLDLAIQIHGSVEQAVALGKQNNMSITDTITPGTLLDAASDVTYENKDVVNYFKKSNKLMAAGSQPKQIVPPPSAYLLPVVFPIE